MKQGNVASNYTTAQPVLQQYLVDNEGKINFPVLGELHVGGLTKKATEQMIVEKLKPYIKEIPIVTVRMVNYKISVIGEVARPGTFTISNEKVNLLEALAMAGDMTVYGLRDDIKLIREDANGRQEIVTLDLNKAETILSPYYWLQQNLSQSRRSGFLGGGFAGSGGGLTVGLQALNALHTQGQAGVYQINAHADDDHDYQYGQGVLEHVLTV